MVNGDYPGKNVSKEQEELITKEITGKKYLEIVNYLNGMTQLKKGGNHYSPKFIAPMGEINCFNSGEHKVIYSKNLKLSEDENTNKRLIGGFERRLNN